MENQHRKIKGYRELSPEEIELMNAVKTYAATGEILCKQIKAHVDAQHRATMPVYDGNTNTKQETEAQRIEAARLTAAEPFRWVAIARTDIQTGTMALTRAIAQPENF